MTAKRRLQVVLTLTLCIMPAEFFLIPALRAAGGTPEEWVEEQAQAGTLPSTAIDVAALPVEYRRAVMKALPAASQSEIWRAHLAGYVGGHPELSQGQIDTINQLAAMATPALMARGADAETQQGLIALAAQLRIDLPEDAYYLAQLGSPGGTIRTSSVVAVLAQAIRTHFVARAEPEDCSCSVYDDWCMPLPTSPTSYCHMSACLCHAVVPGCGTFWQLGCNGLCSQLSCITCHQNCSV